MIDFIYNSLAAIGFTHPLHPSLTHIPMGMVMGAFFFQAASFKWEDLAKSAHYCLLLALIFWPPTAVLGLLDWQHRYLGVLNGLIIAKIVLACVLLVFLLGTIFLYRRGNIDKKILMFAYLLNLLTVVAMGFIGGQLIFG
ncbi:MAG: hypothetical protein EPN93_04500 [Spirochaetes bacterium]|nr:MAG: hypothetical protein EPN93_04500 [Spirochaetota bacterium]